MVDEKTNGVISDMSVAIIGGRIYRSVPRTEKGIFLEDKNRDLVLVQRHKNADDIAYKTLMNEIMIRCIDGGSDHSDQSSIEEEFAEVAGKSRRFRSIIFPFNRFKGENEKKETCSYTVAELPDNFCDKYKTIDSAFRKGNFAFHSRVITALNLAEAFFSLDNYFYGYLTCLVPEAIYINTDDGDVRIIIDRLLSRDIELPEGNNEYLRIVCGDEDTINRSDLLRYLAYTSFRLICIENPYDGKGALIEFPLLTNNAYKAINSGKYGFIFSEAKDEYSEYIDKETYQRWNLLPGKIKDVFSAVLDNKGDALDVGEWLKNMRILRDCLVLVNGQFKLCDPDVSNKVSFLVSDDYYIPVWPRKALYWYHVGIPVDNVAKEVVAGINNDGYIENMTDEQWVVENKSHLAYLAPGKSIKPEMGMDIEINNTHFKVVSGEKAVRTGVDLGNPSDYPAFSIKQEIDIIDLNEE